MPSLPITTRQVDLDNLTELAQYAEVIRIGGQEDFGALGQQREPEDFAALARIPESEIRFYLASIGSDILGALEVSMSAELMPAAEVYIRVPSTFQGYGVGQTLLAHAEKICRDHGRTVLFGTSAARSRRDNRNARFLIKAGFEDIGTELRQDLHCTDFTPRSPEELHVDGIVILPFWGAVDRAFLEDLARLIGTADRLTDPSAPMPVPETLDARIRHTASQQQQLVTLAIEEATGRVVGVNELMIGPHGKLAEQYITFVDEAFRQRGIGAALKETALQEFIKNASHVERVRSFLPADSTIMAQLNRRLGYTDTAFYRRWTKDLTHS